MLNHQITKSVGRLVDELERGINSGANCNNVSINNKQCWYWIESMIDYQSNSIFTYLNFFFILNYVFSFKLYIINLKFIFKKKQKQMFCSL